MNWFALIAILGVLLAIDAVLHLIGILAILPIFERKIAFSVQPAAPDPDAETISFATDDGLELRGSLYRHDDQPARGLIIFCPELSGSHWSAMSYCAGLWNSGFNLLSFDFRNQGESDSQPGYQPMHWLTGYEVADVHAAIRYARNHPELKSQPIGLVGISRGGGAALAAAAESPHVSAVAAEGAFSTFSLSMHYILRWATLYVPAWLLRPLPLWHLRLTVRMVCRISRFRTGRPYLHLESRLSRLRDRDVLLIAGASDSYVHPDVTRQIDQRIPGSKCRLWIVPKATHNQARTIDPEGYDQAMEQLFAGIQNSGGPSVRRVQSEPQSV